MLLAAFRKYNRWHREASYRWTTITNGQKKTIWLVMAVIPPAYLAAFYFPIAWLAGEPFGISFSTLYVIQTFFAISSMISLIYRARKLSSTH